MVVCGAWTASKRSAVEEPHSDIFKYIRTGHGDMMTTAPAAPRPSLSQICFSCALLRLIKKIGAHYRGKPPGKPPGKPAAAWGRAVLASALDAQEVASPTGEPPNLSPCT